jgi:spectinomycin phosphotransferase
VIEKPDIPDSVLADGVRDGWGLLVEELAFMPVGLDGAAWAYEVRLVGGGRRFLKVRTDEFTRPARTLPSFLFDHGLPQVVAPIGGVRAIGRLRLALYPFVDGPSLWSRGLTDAQWTAYGRFLGALHAVELPAEVARLLPTERYASTAPDRVRALAGPAGADPALGPLWRRHGKKLSAWADEAEWRERDASVDPPPVVVCHADIHPGNLLADGDDDLRVVDWDAPLWAPPERDLMFVFGTDFGEHPINARREALFRAGYGPLVLDDALLRYYRLERRLDDAARCAATVLDESATETAQVYELELLIRILES